MEEHVLSPGGLVLVRSGGLLRPIWESRIDRDHCHKGTPAVTRSPFGLESEGAERPRDSRYLRPEYCES